MFKLTDAEIDEVLMRNGIGTLAVNDGQYPYPLPMSFGYDREKPIFVMQFGDAGESRKLASLDNSTKAGFLVYEKLGEGLETEWRSVIMGGDVEAIDEDRQQEGFTALASNAEFAPDMTVWGASLEDTELTLYELDVETCTGRGFSINS